jgi:hypothetical protein
VDNNALLDASQFPGKNGGERIQAALDSLGTKPKVIDVGPQGSDLDGRWLLTKAIVIPSNTTLVFHGSRLFMADKVSDNMIRNFHAETGDSERDENIHILGLSGAELDGNAVNQDRQAHVHKNFGIAFHKVDKASIKGIVLGPTEGWGMGLENVNDLLLRVSDSSRMEKHITRMESMSVVREAGSVSRTSWAQSQTTRSRLMLGQARRITVDLPVDPADSWKILWSAMYL